MKRTAEGSYKVGKGRTKIKTTETEDESKGELK